jgi:hypothetical protein
MHLFGYCNTASSHSSKDLCSAQKRKRKSESSIGSEMEMFLFYGAKVGTISDYCSIKISRKQT